MTPASVPPVPPLALPEDPPGFIVATEAQKAASARGFRLQRGADGPRLRYASTTAPGEVWLAWRPPNGQWWLAVSHPGVAAELGPTTAMPGAARFAYAALPELYATLDRAYRLARSLPTLPLAAFQQAGRRAAPHHRGRAPGPCSASARACSAKPCWTAGADAAP